MFEFLASTIANLFPFITHQYTNFEPKTPILLQLGAFNYYFLKIHPIYVHWVFSSVMKTPDRYTKIREKAPQKAGTYIRTPCQCEYLPWACIFFAGVFHLDRTGGGEFHHR